MISTRRSRDVRISWTVRQVFGLRDSRVQKSNTTSSGIMTAEIIGTQRGDKVGNSNTSALVFDLSSIVCSCIAGHGQLACAPRGVAQGLPRRRRGAGKGANFAGQPDARW